ncbi:MAG: hypothetical protein ACRDN9_00885 [Streptosporangiaceae bacterium]
MNEIEVAFNSPSARDCGQPTLRNAPMMGESPRVTDRAATPSRTNNDPRIRI